MRIGICILALGCGIAQAGAEVITWEAALEMALESSEQIEIQRRQVSIAEQEVGRAWAIVSPRLTATGRYDRPESEIRRDDDVLVPEDTWRVTLTATQPLFDGRVLSARRGGLVLEEAEAHTLAHTIRTTLFDVSRSYYAVLRAEQQLTIAEQTLSLSTQEVSRAKARFEAGEARRTEYLRAEVDAARASRNVVATRNALETAKSDLARQLGLDPDSAFSVARPDATPDPETEYLSDLVEQALINRNDVAAFRLQLSFTEEELRFIRRGGWPTLELQYNHHFVDPESPTTRNNTWDIAAVARYEFWDGGSRRISRRQQEERVSQAMLRLRDLEKSVQLEVQRALLELRTIREDLQALDKEVRLAEENYRTLSEQARVGLATSLDVSTALNELDRVRTERVTQTFEYELAKQQLDWVTGLFAADYIEVMSSW